MLLTILATIFVLGVLVFFHELGHFLVAKWSGIRVERFSLGFPPTIFKKKMGKDTEYCIGAIPFGGYVKMAGDNPVEGVTGAPWEFMSKPVWKRSLVVLAGPLINYVLAVVILFGLFLYRGSEKQEVFVGAVGENSPAAQAGINIGDKIISINGIEVKSFEEMATIIYEKVEEPVEISWINMSASKPDTITASVTTYKDRILGISGDSVTVGKIGVGSMLAYEPMGFFPSWRAAIDRSLEYARLIFDFIGGLFTGKYKASSIGGPIFIGKVAGATARAGFDILLDFMALLSVNLAILNILPIPLFDGSHLLLFLIEKIKGTPVSTKVRVFIQQIGIAFVLLLVIFVTFNDLTR